MLSGTCTHAAASAPLSIVKSFRNSPIESSHFCMCMKSTPLGRAKKVLGWPKICKLAHTFLLEYSYKVLKLAQLASFSLGVVLGDRVRVRGDGVQHEQPEQQRPAGHTQRHACLSEFVAARSSVPDALPGQPGPRGLK